MPTLEQISTDIDSAKVYYVNKAAILLNNIKQGFGSAESIKSLKRLIMALTFQINAGVVDVDTETMYKCLLEATNGFVGDYSYDPTVKIPGETIIVEQVKSKTIFDFTEGVLLDAGGDNWYLPIDLINGLTPVSVKSNGASFTFTDDSTGIFGFGGNYEQAIEVIAI